MVLLHKAFDCSSLVLGFFSSRDFQWFSILYTSVAPDETEKRGGRCESVEPIRRLGDMGKCWDGLMQERGSCRTGA